MISTSSAPIMESSAYGSKDETEPTPRVTCDFALPDCDHSSVFDDVYLRTNRTNHTKIMRCFPHCCPHHRERSYCGSSVHLTVHSTTALKRDQLVVYGRFRPMHTEPLACGTRLTAVSVEASLQSKDPSKGQWIESKAIKSQNRSDKRSQLFEINPSGRWYYPWSGAATIAMRQVEHIFEAHVFRRVGSELELVALAGSSTFRVMSFRRGTTLKEEVVSPPRSVSVPQKRKAVTRTASPTTLTDGQHRPAQASATVQQLPLVAEDRRHAWISNDNMAAPSIFSVPRFPSELSAARLPSLTPPQLLAPVSSYRPAFPDVTLPLRALLNPAPDTVQPRSSVVPSPVRAASYSEDDTLSSILRWLHECPANSFDSQWLLAWERIVDKACETQITAPRAPDSSQSDLVPVMSALDVSAPSLSQSKEGHEPSVDAVDAVVRLLLHLWLDKRSTDASAEAVDRFLRGGFRTDGVALASAHSAWLSDVTSRAQQFLRQETSVPWAQIRALTRSREESDDPASHADGFSYRSFVAQCREQVVLQHKRSSHSRKRQRRAELPAGLRNTARVWRCRMEDASIQMNDNGQRAFSLLAIVQFWKHLSCLRLCYSSAQDFIGLPAQLSVVSVFNSLNDDGGVTKLMLDGQYRWFNCLPSGEPTIGTTLMGYVVGDYVGRSTSAGTVHLTTYLWPATSETSVAYAWHWTLDASLLTSHSSPSVVSVVVESASVARCPYAMETMSMAEKLRYVGHWQQICELQLVFRAE